MAKALLDCKFVAFIDTIVSKKTKETSFQAVIEVKGSHGICDQDGNEIRFFYSPKFDKRVKADKALTSLVEANGWNVKLVLSPAEQKEQDEAKAKEKAEKAKAKEAKLAEKAAKSANKKSVSEESAA